MVKLFFKKVCRGVGGETPDIKALLRRGRDAVPTNPVNFLKKAEPKTFNYFWAFIALPLKIFSQVFYKKLVGGVGGETPDIKALLRRGRDSVPTNHCFAIVAALPLPANNLASLCSAEHCASLGLASLCSAEHCASLGLASLCSAEHCASLGLASLCSAEHCASLGLASLCSAEHCASLGLQKV